MVRQLILGLTWILSVGGAQKPESGPGPNVPAYDPFRSMEMRVFAAKNKSGEEERDLRVRREFERRAFESRFNELVNALSNFSRQYNGGRGAVWPQREAEQLGKAIRKLQDSLKATSVK
jgi:hypothetical protein